MSRLGKKPIAIPSGVTVAVSGSRIQVTGPKGTLERAIPAIVLCEVQDSNVILKVEHQQSKFEKAQWGLAAALICGMIKGVVDGYEKKLEISGIGFRAEMSGDAIQLYVGYTNPVIVPVPSGIKVSVDKSTVIVSGIDKELVGAAAAKLRAVKPPEPYKGKGIRYQNEIVHRKAGKAAKAAGA